MAHQRQNFEVFSPEIDKNHPKRPENTYFRGAHRLFSFPKLEYQQGGQIQPDYILSTQYFQT